MNPPPTSSINLHPALPSSIELHSAHFSLHPAPSSSTSSLHHPQQYFNQNIARNWAISANLGRKIKSCPFWLKISTRGIMKVFIPNPDLGFWNSDPKIHFWEILAQNFEVVRFFWKLVYIVSQGCWFLIQAYSFNILTPNSIFEQVWAQKFKVFCFVWKLVHMVSQGCWFLFQH